MYFIAIIIFNKRYAIINCSYYQIIVCSYVRDTVQSSLVLSVLSMSLSRTHSIVIISFYSAPGDPMAILLLCILIAIIIFDKRYAIIHCHITVLLFVVR
jgi:hypothetical protein